MEFIKAFLLFLLFVLIMGIVLAILMYIVYIFISTLILLVKNFKNFLLFILRNQDWTPKGLLKTFKKQFLYYINFIKSLKPTKKIIIVYTVIFTLSSIVFYASRVNTYLLSDRPYKEAKAYAIAGEYLFLFQGIYANYKTIDTFFYRALESMQKNLILKNIYRLILETDGERDIWNYRLVLNVYARSYWAPITDEDKKKGLHYALGADFTPEFIPLFNSMYNNMINLSELSIEDKEFSRFERYLHISMLLPYYTRYYARQVDLRWDSGDVFSIFFTTPKYIEQFNKFIKVVDTTKEAIEKDNELADRWEAMPNTKAFFYQGGEEGYSNLIAKIRRIDNLTPCNTKEMSQYTKYVDEFLTWAEDKRSSFNKFKNNVRNRYMFRVMNGDLYHYIAKYVCGEHFNTLAEYEKYSIEIGRATKDTLKDYYNYNNVNYFTRYTPYEKTIRETVELNKNNNKEGEKNGR